MWQAVALLAAERHLADPFPSHATAKVSCLHPLLPALQVLADPELLPFFESLDMQEQKMKQVGPSPEGGMTGGGRP